LASEHFDAAIVGAGIVGLALAYFMLKARPGLQLVVVEKEAGPGLHQTGHNSGVIHAGIYYAAGSLKARLCKAGAAATKRFCRENGIAFEECGKLIVATDTDELPRLDELESRARANGLRVERIGAGEIAEREPHVRGKAALYSPASGIVDYARICRVLRDGLAAGGVTFRFGEAATRILETANGVTLGTTGGVYNVRLLLACAGLQADRIARMSGLGDDFRIVPFRGEYYRVSDKARVGVNHLIYPVPDPSLPFLGIHLTRMIGGYATVGPNAMLSLGRETYGGNSLVARDLMPSLAFPGFWKLMARSVRPGLRELAGAVSKSVYLRRCRRYAPGLALDDLEPHPPGIRAQAVGRDGRMIDDFLLRETRRTIHVCNAPSPAATSAFPIGAEIGRRALEKLA